MNETQEGLIDKDLSAYKSKAKNKRNKEEEVKMFSNPYNQDGKEKSALD